MCEKVIGTNISARIVYCKYVYLAVFLWSNFPKPSFFLHRPILIWFNAKNALLFSEINWKTPIRLQEIKKLYQVEARKTGKF